jgi:hypothetical protein
VGEKKMKFLKMKKEGIIVGFALLVLTVSSLTYQGTSSVMVEDYLSSFFEFRGWGSGQLKLMLSDDSSFKYNGYNSLKVEVVSGGSCIQPTLFHSFGHADMTGHEGLEFWMYSSTTENFGVIFWYNSWGGQVSKDFPLTAGWNRFFLNFTDYPNANWADVTAMSIVLGYNLSPGKVFWVDSLSLVDKTGLPPQPPSVEPWHPLNETLTGAVQLNRSVIIDKGCNLSIVNAELTFTDRNLNITNHGNLTILNSEAKGFGGIYSDGTLFVDGWNVTDCKMAFYLAGDNAILKNMIIVNITDNAITLTGKYNLLENIDLGWMASKAFVDIRDGGAFNIIKNAKIHDYVYQSTANDVNSYAIVCGFGAHNNTFINCESWRTGEPFVDTSTTENNTWIDCYCHECHWGKVTQDSSRNCLIINLTARNIEYTAFITEAGASDNHFYNCTAIDCRVAFRFQNCSGNIYEACKAVNCEGEVALNAGSHDNILINVFYSKLDISDNSSATAEYTLDGWNGKVIVHINEANPAWVKSLTYESSVLIMNSYGEVQIHE